MAFWLLKSEPTTFSIDDLSLCKKQTEPWTGVRNYQARTMLRDRMKLGDLGFFYHSSCTPPGIVGIVEVVKEGYPDPTSFDPQSPYFDPKTSPAKPRWYCVDVKLVKKFSEIISLPTLKSQKALRNMLVIRPGNRLSITPVEKEEWEFILAKLAPK